MFRVKTLFFSLKNATRSSTAHPPRISTSCDLPKDVFVLMHSMDGWAILSVVANIAGIFTFSFAVVASIATVHALTANALKEIERLYEEWDNASKEVLLLHRYWHSEKLQGNAELERNLRDMQSSMDALAETALSIYRELKNLQATEAVNCLILPGLRRRVLWIWRRQDILDKMAEFGRRRQGLIHMQLGLLLTKSISQGIEWKSHKALLTTMSVAYRSGSEVPQRSTTLVSSEEDGAVIGISGWKTHYNNPEGRVQT